MGVYVVYLLFLILLPPFYDIREELSTHSYQKIELRRFYQFLASQIDDNITHYDFT